MSSTSESPVQCRLPNRGNTSNRFIEYSCYGRHNVRSKDPGIGNILVFYPTVYTYAMVTGRDVIIPDHSALGNWCRALKCGFPFLSEVVNKHAKLKNINNVRSLGIQEANEAMTKNISIVDETLCVHGLSSVATQWYIYSSPHTAKCVSDLTGCAVSDVGCVERFAFHQLFPGGMSNGSIPSPLCGVNQSEFDNLLHSPYQNHTRFDGAVHIRAQLSHLERHYDANVSDVEESVAKYIPTFEKINSKLSLYYFQDPITRDRWRKLSSNVTEWPRIFVTCDDVTIRGAFLKVLQNRTVDEGLIWPIFINSTAVVHSGKTDNLLNKSQAYIDTAFDWYILSLTNTAFTWRTGGSRLISTFAQSALRVSLKRPDAAMKAYLLDSSGKWIPVWDWE